MTTDDLLAAYDDQLRTDAEMARAHEVVREGPLLWGVFDHGGFVSYRDLGGVEGEALDALIERTVAHYRDDTDVASFEWKSRGHDLPADLGERLVAHGLVAEPRETVMIGEATLLDVDVPLAETPEGPVVVRRLEPGPSVRDDAHPDARRAGVGLRHRSRAVGRVVTGRAGVRRLGVLGRRGRRTRRLRRPADPGPGHRVRRHLGRLDAAGLPRPRDLPRARRRPRPVGDRPAASGYINSDCTDMSRPILERSGLQAVTTTTPYVWSR